MWAEVRRELRAIVGEQTFEIWLAALDLIAVDHDRQLLLSAPYGTRNWVADRFARVLDRAAGTVGRAARLAVDRELQLLEALTNDHKEAV